MTDQIARYRRCCDIRIKIDVYQYFNLTMFLSCGIFDSRDWVRLVMWVRRKNPETKKDVQKMNSSKPFPPISGRGSKDKTPPTAPTPT